MSRHIVSVSLVLCGIGLMAGIAPANWIETFNAGSYDLPTWNFYCYPDITKTYAHSIKTGTGGNSYLSLDEPASTSVYGSAFGAAIASNEVFQDVRIGAVVNAGADSSRAVHGLGARANYEISTGSPYPAPGFIAKATYVMLIGWNNGPTNVGIEVQKVVTMQNIMANNNYVVAVPGVLNQRSFYAELDVVGSGPVYITGSLYEYKGGPLVARTPTLIDTNAKDDWEDDTKGVSDAVFPAGVSAIFAMNEKADPVGYHISFDDLSSTSDGPSAVPLGPANGATGLPLTQTLTWVKPAYATSSQVWFGKAGSMSRFTSTGASFDTGVLEAGKTYQWRVDMVGPSGIVEGITRSFSTTDSIPFEDFETYAGNAPLRLVWDPNMVPGQQLDPNSVNFLDTTTASHGTKSMRMDFQNQIAPFYHEFTRTLTPAQDWTANGVKALSLSFRGKSDNVEQRLYVKLSDAEGHAGIAALPAYAAQAANWSPWSIDLSTIAAQGVNLAAIAKVTIGGGDGNKSGQAAKDTDTLWVDDLRLYPPRCFNSAGLELYADANGDCRVDLEDFAMLAAEWLNNGVSVTP
jgi:hypothetical protein